MMNVSQQNGQLQEDTLNYMDSNEYISPTCETQ